MFCLTTGKYFIDCTVDYIVGGLGLLLCDDNMGLVLPFELAAFLLSEVRWFLQRLVPFAYKINII